jgi:hypothetical protein
MKQFELFFLDLSEPSNKSKLEYKTIHYFINNDRYNKRSYEDVNNLQVGETTDKSYSTIHHFIRRLT